MTSRLTICDESLRGERSNVRVMDLVTDRITVRELLRERVYEEVREYNAAQGDYFRGLVQPTDTEATLNGFKMRTRRPLSWETQFEKALTAWERNGFFVLVGDRQVESLDEIVEVRPDVTVSFMKLMPLVGG